MMQRGFLACLAVAVPACASDDQGSWMPDYMNKDTPQDLANKRIPVWASAVAALVIFPTLM